MKSISDVAREYGRIINPNNWTAAMHEHIILCCEHVLRVRDEEWRKKEEAAASTMLVIISRDKSMTANTKERLRAHLHRMKRRKFY